MGKVAIKASLIIHLIDSYSEKEVVGAVRITDKYGRRALRKEFDHFVFINLPLGENVISIESAYYLKKTVTADVTEKPQRLELRLSPNRNYHFDKNTFFLSGKVYTDYAAAALSSDKLKIVEGCKKGESSVRIFGSECIENEKVLIEHDGKYNIYSIKKGSLQLEVNIAPTAKTDISATDRLYMIYEAEPDSNGEYFLPIHGTANEIILISDNSVKKVKTDTNHLKYDFTKGK